MLRKRRKGLAISLRNGHIPLGASDSSPFRVGVDPPNHRSYGVFQMPRTPAFRVASGETSQLSCGISRRHPPPFDRAPSEFSEYTEFSDDALSKNGFARKEIYFLCICTMLVILISILNARLIALLLYSGHQFMHCTFLLCVQCKVKLCCLFLSWFAKEANVANNNND